MVIEKVTLFVRSANSNIGEQSVSGPKLVQISLPRVKFIEGAEFSDKYLLEESMNVPKVAVAPSRMRNTLYRRK